MVSGVFWVLNFGLYFFVILYFGMGDRICSFDVGGEGLFLIGGIVGGWGVWVFRKLGFVIFKVVSFFIMGVLYFGY